MTRSSLVLAVLTVTVLVALAAPMASAQPAVVIEEPRLIIENPDVHLDAGHAHRGALGDVPKQMQASTGAALAFWFFALACIAGAGFVITRRNLVSAVMGMVGTFMAVAALYAMLYAHFLTAIQVLVYAGAIMVLFVFVIMILNRPEDEPWGITGVPGKAVAGLALAYLFWRLASVLIDVEPQRVTANLAPGPTVTGDDFGSVAAVGKVLFGDYLFPFEAVSIVLLVAVVGAIMIARPTEPSAEHVAGGAET